MNAAAPVTAAGHTLPGLLAGMGAHDVPDIRVERVAVDSRAVVDDTLFMAYAGARSHGLDHAAEATERGATVIAWDRDTPPALDVPNVRVPRLAAKAGAIAARAYGHPSQRLFATGITGTDGKTSCAWLLAGALTALGERCGYMGTLGYGLVDALAAATHTTPDPVTVQDRLARLVGAEAKAVALEVSSHALDQHRVDGVAFDVAVLTQIGRDHLDYHASIGAYAAAKRRLFGFPGLRHAVLNGDDAYGRAWLAELEPVVTPIVYGFGEVAGMARDYVGLRRVHAHAGGLAVDLDTSWGAARIDSPLIGRFNAANLAAVLAVLLAHGRGLAEAAAALARVPAVPGRMQKIRSRRDQPLVVVDYAHTPGALGAALGALRAHTEARVLCVFGCGGDRDAGKRALMGAAAARCADMLWLTDDNPRSEDPQAIVAAIRLGIPPLKPVRVIHDRAAAIADAIACASADDVVLIAGKGHETTQQIGARYRPFDDRTAARDALEPA